MQCPIHGVECALTSLSCTWVIVSSRVAIYYTSILPSGLCCEGGGDVVGVVTPLVRGGAQVLHGDQVVELSVLLEVHEREEE